MLKIFVVGIMALVFISTLFWPWIGGITYIVMSVLSPQNIWFWGFEDIRSSYVIVLAIATSSIIHLLLGNISLSVWKSKQNVLVLFIWIMIICSYFFGAYPPNTLGSNNMNSDLLLRRYSIVFVMYFMIQPLITELKIISRLIWGLVLVFGFYTYWANYQYISGEMFQRGVSLTGPSFSGGSGNYTDENTLAMLFVMAIPFFYYLGQENRNKFIKIALYLLIPFAWHSVFLTGSRGGLVGLAAITLHMVIRTPKKIYAVLLVIGLVMAFIYQSGDYMKHRASTISRYEEESSAQQRIEAWTMASRMCKDHPLLGVGLGNFTVAWEKYSSSTPRVAHSSIIELAAENGVLAGLAFAVIFVLSWLDLRNIRRKAMEIHGFDDQRASKILSIVNALEGACFGYFVCGLFLSLGSYEIFYFIIMIVVSLRWNIASTNSSGGTGVNSIEFSPQMV